MYAQHAAKKGEKAEKRMGGKAEKRAAENGSRRRQSGGDSRNVLKSLRIWPQDVG